jgi:hypothetical protein
VAALGLLLAGLFASHSSSADGAARPSSLWIVIIVIAAAAVAGLFVWPDGRTCGRAIGES